MHILSPETDNCPSWISGRERMTVENISWSISTKECCRPRRGLKPRPPGLQSDGASKWATEAGWMFKYVWCLTLMYDLSRLVRHVEVAFPEVVASLPLQTWLKSFHTVVVIIPPPPPPTPRSICSKGQILSLYGRPLFRRLGTQESKLEVTKVVSRVKHDRKSTC